MKPIARFAITPPLAQGKRRTVRSWPPRRSTPGRRAHQLAVSSASWWTAFPARPQGAVEQCSAAFGRFVCLISTPWERLTRCRCPHRVLRPQRLPQHPLSARTPRELEATSLPHVGTWTEPGRANTSRPATESPRVLRGLSSSRGAREAAQCDMRCARVEAA